MTWTLLPIAKFDAHARDWDALQARVAGLPFLESLFLAPLLASFGSGQELLALHHGAAGLDAAAILSKSGKGQWATFQPSQLPLGAWLSAQDKPLEPLFASLLGALPLPTLALGVTQIDSRLHPRPADSGRLRQQDYIDTGWVEVQGGFDAYWDARGKNLKQNIKKQQKKLESLDQACRLECLDTAADVPQALADYGRLEASGWKGGEGTAIAPGHPQYEFYRAMLENFARLGRARIYQYLFNEQVVSMDLCIESGTTLVILKTAYDEAHKAVSPSTLMRQKQFQALFEEGLITHIEFYGKMMEWHTRWTSLARPLYHSTCYRWPLLKHFHEALRARAAPSPAAAQP